ncbi:MAG: S9 family peptidase [Gammaproteobacteria bacterium]|nr:S9 family peptidase [Gammaproteobacteria bacterium]NIR84814.1 S9 family peptidase [Gammaproteobacteria bacterium]NIR91528.1 S9 family peptidase [Gammaproteobacteria bacterium]NIU05861.1 S9 family peptidase [Gammaproteobacteria bacterium]NIV76716.1 prolyl oligopeptidase family serine peptidase [Gammaproteobacteria bacterium]
MSEPPIAKRESHVRVRHGERAEDPYAWLRDDNWQEVMRSPERLRDDIREYLEAENAYTRAVLAPTETLQDRLFDEMKGRIKEDDASVPEPDGAFAYYVRFDTGGQHPIFCRRRTEDAAGAEEILLHGDREAEGHPYFHVAACEHSPQHRLLAYAVDLTGSEFYTIRFKDLDTGAVLEEELPNAQGGCVWANDGATLFYTVLDEHHRPSRVFRHRVGTPVASDALVYAEPDPGFFVGVDRTESRRFILIDAHDHETSEVRLIDADAPQREPILVAPREREILYDVSHHEERLLILTNADGAEDFKLVQTPVDNPGRAHWRDLVAHRPGTLIVAFTVLREYMARLERIDGLPRIVVTRLSDDDEHEIAFGEEAYSLGLSPGYEFDSRSLRLTYSSLTTAQRTFDYDMQTRARVLRKEQEVPSGHDSGDYVTRRLFATSHDGERVPISVLHRKDTPLDGSAPVLLYGYGAYGLAVPAAFGTNRLSLVDRGFVYAIAHVRGGTERGYRWYREGKTLKKRNTFLDFIAAAEALVAARYTRAGRIACHGGSAGGMLAGAVANMRPGLFAAVVAEVPFVDVLNTMCDDTLPLTPPEWPEWGNPIADPDAYAYIKSYSPYDNVEAKAYPHILATAGLADPRVTYWEPAKWVAKLRRHKTDAHLLLLKTNMEAGHAGAAGRFDHLKEIALVYAFLLKVFERAPSA